MAKKAEMKDLLTGQPKAQGWRDQFEEKPEESKTAKPPKYRRKTYLLNEGLIQRVEVQASNADVGINEMCRYLLTLALDMVEDGEHEIKVSVQTVEKRTLEV